MVETWFLLYHHLTVMLLMTEVMVHCPWPLILEIIINVLACKCEESFDEEVVEKSCVSASEAFDALETTLHWLEQAKADSAHLL